MADDSDKLNGSVSTDASRSAWQRAGPFGFSRLEIVALLMVAGVAGALSFYQWWNKRLAAEGPEWPIEDVAIGAGSAQSSAFTTRSPARIDTGFAREAPADTRLDVNTADLGDLVRLPGIGPELALRIIHDRQERGLFVDLIDFQRVRGIGPKKAAMLAGWIWFSAPDTSRNATPDSVGDE